MTKTDLLTPFERRVLERGGVVSSNLKRFAAVYAELLKEWDVSKEEKKKLNMTMVDSWINLCTYQLPREAPDDE